MVYPLQDRTNIEGSTVLGLEVEPYFKYLGMNISKDCKDMLVINVSPQVPLPHKPGKNVRSMPYSSIYFAPLSP